MTSIMHQRYSLRHRKPLTKFEFKALFREVMLNTHIHKTHIILKSIRHLSLRLESKNIDTIFRNNVSYFVKHLKTLFV